MVEFVQTRYIRDIRLGRLTFDSSDFVPGFGLSLSATTVSASFRGHSDCMRMQILAGAALHGARE